jgi:glycerophosphoryl diester phosphodiesterase
VLDWLPDGVGLVVEIKARTAVEATVAALRDTAVRRAGHASLISFDQPSIDHAHELDPELTTGYLLVPTEPFEPALRYAVEHGHAAVHPWDGDLGLDPVPKLAMAMSYGRQVGCYVVNDPQRMQHLAAVGLWGFVTDVPDVAREALGPRSA